MTFYIPISVWDRDQAVQCGRVKISQAAIWYKVRGQYLHAPSLLACARKSPSPQRKAPEAE